MSFQWPEMLWLALALPALVGAYVWVLRRKKKLALRYANLAIVREAMSAGQTLRRHIPPLLLLAALALMVLAIARPNAVVTLPSQHETVILAMDVSGSMRAADVEPNRLAAAQTAAKAFIAEQPENVRVGIVAFAGTATVAQAPTRDREALVAAMRSSGGRTVSGVLSRLIPATRRESGWTLRTTSNTALRSAGDAASSRAGSTPRKRTSVDGAVFSTAHQVKSAPALTSRNASVLPRLSGPAGASR